MKRMATAESKSRPLKKPKNSGIKPPFHILRFRDGPAGGFLGRAGHAPGGKQLQKNFPRRERQFSGNSPEISELH